MAHVGSYVRGGVEYDAIVLYACVSPYMFSVGLSAEEAIASFGAGYPKREKERFVRTLKKGDRKDCYVLQLPEGTTHVGLRLTSYETGTIVYSGLTKKRAVRLTFNPKTNCWEA